MVRPGTRAATERSAASPSGRPLLEIEPGILGSGERDVDIGQLARDAAHLDEVGLDARVADRELEVALAQPEPRQLRLGRRLLAPVGLLGQLLFLPTSLPDG